MAVVEMDGLYAEYGSPKIEPRLGPLLVFVHGFALDHRMWMPTTRFFNDIGYPTLAVDLRGFGKSQNPSGDYCHCSDLVKWLDHLDIQQAVWVGLSIGALAVAQIVNSFPERVEAGVLVSTTLRKRDRQTSDPDDARAKWLSSPLFANLKGEPSSMLATMVGEYSGWHWQYHDPETGVVPEPDEVVAKNVPLMIVVGNLDDRYFLEQAGKFKLRYRGRRRVVMGAGHMVPMEKPGLFNMLLFNYLQFLAEGR